RSRDDDRHEGGNGRGDDPQLAGHRGRDVEVAGDVDEDRREDEDCGLAREDAHEEGRRRGREQAPGEAPRYRRRVDSDHPTGTLVSSETWDKAAAPPRGYGRPYLRERRSSRPGSRRT